MRKNIYVALFGLLLAASACSDDTPYQATVEPEEDAGTNNGEADTPIDEPDMTIPDPDMGSNNGEPDLPIIEPDAGFEPACSLEDGAAPNQSPDEAAEIGSDVIDNFFLCGDTSDWFAFDAEAGQTIVLWTNFDPNFGDIDIYLYEDGRTGEDQQVAESTSPNQAEYIEYEVQTSGRFLFEVRSFQGAETAYQQVIKVQCQSDADCPDGSACHLRNRWCYAEDRELSCGVDEGYEPNETTATATPIEVGEETVTLEELSICPEDEDYYRLEIGADSGFVSNLRHAQNTAVDLILYKENGEFAARGADRGRTGEELRALYLEAGTYILVVDMRNFQGAGPTTYDLDFTVVPGRCTTDADCSGLLGREFCNADTGVCFGIDSDGGQGLFDPCDDDGDCSDETEGCYEGTPGSGDNICTIVCSSADDNCADIEEGAYCQILDRLADFGICTPACESDFDCSTNLYCDTDAGRCVSRGCLVDADCPRDGEACIFSDTEYQGGRCLPYTEPELECGVGASPDDMPNGSSSSAQVLPLDGPSGFFEGLSICDEDDDWYVLELTGDSSNLTVDVGFEGNADVDVYLYSEDGRQYGEGIEPDANPEQAVTEFIPAGRYFVRVNGFPIDNGDDEVAYNIQVNVGEADCRMLEGSCDDSSPLRIVCDEATGACKDFEGNGEVEIGGACDTFDDCNEDADLCFSFFGAENGQNICTHTCTSQRECNDVPDTECRPIRRGLGVCIQGGR